MAISRYLLASSGLEERGRCSRERSFRQDKTNNRPWRLRKKVETMKNPQSKSLGSSMTTASWLATSLLALLGLAATSSGYDGRSGNHHRLRPPSVPAGLEVPAGNELKSHATGVGVQIYVWTINPTNPALASWVFKAPHAVLFAPHDDDQGSVVGIHFAGPIWQGNDGSKVAAARVAGVTVDPSAVPWLLLKRTTATGVGVFDDITYIQRLKTVGGLAPTTPGSSAGEEVLVPYVADYYFYHASQ